MRFQPLKALKVIATENVGVMPVGKSLDFDGKQYVKIFNFFFLQPGKRQTKRKQAVTPKMPYLGGWNLDI